MKKILYNNKKIYIFGNTEEYKKIVVISQGLSDNHTSSFMTYLINELVEKSYLVFTYEYGFFIKKQKVSDYFKDEMMELDLVLEYVEKNYQDNEIILVGKSLGGVLCLAYQAKNNNQKIFKIYILGLPIVLGYPVKLELLKEENPVLPNFFEEYKKLVENIETNITIVQGEGDDLYDKESAEKLFSEVKYIENANHNFCNFETMKDCYGECIRACNF